MHIINNFLEVGTEFKAAKEKQLIWRAFAQKWNLTEERYQTSLLFSFKVCVYKKPGK